MKKVININFQGRVIPIEENAFEVLNKYIESLRKYFANEEGRDEIINDIEGRIAELFGETIKKNNSCITEDDVNRIIDSMGRPEDFDDENINTQNSNNQHAQEQQYTFNNNEHKKMFRDENNKILGGVCSGVANYFGIDPVVVRILFVIFFGVMFVPYIILWAVIPSSATQVIGSKRKRLYRDAESKVIAGVCSGLSHYFGISVWIPRLFFILPFITFIFRFSNWANFGHPSFFNITFSPTALLVYIILWMILPEAKTTSEKLEMKGEKVDLNNIKNTIQGDIESFAKRAESFGQTLKEKGTELGNNFNEKSKQFATEANTEMKKRSRDIGDIIALIAKICVYFILGCILIAIVAALFGIGITTTSLLPLKKYIVTDGWQNYFTWGTLIFFIWVPVVGVVVFIIRRVTKMKKNSNLIGYTFSALWAIGWICFINLIALLTKDFKYHNNAYEETVKLENTVVNRLDVKAINKGKYFENTWFKIEPFSFIDDDSVTIGNVRIRVIKSTTDSFSVKMVRLSNGKSKTQADELASKINYQILQTDSSLILDKGITITAKEKFRNQNVIVTIAVPVGKKIFIEKNAGWYWHEHLNESFMSNFGDSWYDSDEKAYSWRYNTEYIMTEKGLKKTSADVNNDDNSDSNTNWSLLRNNFQKNLLDKATKWNNRENKIYNNHTFSNLLNTPTQNIIKPLTSCVNKNNLWLLRFSI